MWLLILQIVVAVLVVGLVYATQVLKIGMKDVKFLIVGLKFRREEAQAIDDNLILSKLWKRRLQTDGRNRDAIIYVDTDKTYTMGQIEELANRVAHFGVQNGLKPGMTVALYMENKPEYVCFWLGMMKIGVKVALLNFNLKTKALVHSMKVSESKLIFFSKALEENLVEVQDEIKDLEEKLYCWGGDSDIAENFDEALEKMPKREVDSKHKAETSGVKMKDAALYIYTSGTTGLPKAAIITHHRIWVAATAFSNFFHINDKDRVYCTLPLYHSAGGLLGVGFLFKAGATMILRKKFSASKFSHDIRKYNATIVQYIGELCRYVMNHDGGENDKDNKVRLAVGNGMRPDVWKSFQSRFNIPLIGEFYAATEGPGALFNFVGQFGACGFISPLVEKIIPSKIVKFDVEKEEVVRDSKGRCILCKPGETGQYIAKILVVKQQSNYSGYTNKEASEKKILKNVFEEGDSWFASGDLMKMDDQGFVYFVDRIGDTFRWKGENCATSEISEICFTYENASVFEEVNVYGVELPHHDGRAGMAAVVMKEGKELDTKKFTEYVKHNLAKYALPQFIRFLPQMDTTGTFKHQKVKLRNEGANPSAIKDKILYFTGKDYEVLTQALYDDICNEKLKM